MQRRRMAVVGLALVLGALLPSGPAVAVTRRALPFPIPAPAAQPPPCPPPGPPGPPAPPLPTPTVPNAAIPVVAAAPARHVDLGPVTGKGIWITVFPGDPVDVASIVARARTAGLHQIWIRTGSTHDGFYGQFLETLVPAAHADGIDVIAWDFPTMSNPAADAARARLAFRYGVDGFSADVEEEPEGTYLSVRRVAYYFSLVRHIAGSRLVVATVPRPTSASLAGYPYVAEAPYVDVFAPMVYWSCTEPGIAVGEAVEALKALRPVAPVGQDYNMASEGGPSGLPTGAQIWRFVDVAHRDGSLGVSLYDLEAGGPTQLATLSAYPW